MTEFQHPPFYIDSSPVCYIINFLTRDFLGVRQVRGGLFRPKLYTNGLSWQTISWYHPFKYRVPVFCWRVQYRYRYCYRIVLLNSDTSITFFIFLFTCKFLRLHICGSQNRTQKYNFLSKILLVPVFSHKFSLLPFSDKIIWKAIWISLHQAGIL
jgi:hypothetical protein